jgi:hypothetical protein
MLILLISSDITFQTIAMKVIEKMKSILVLMVDLSHQ